MLRREISRHLDLSGAIAFGLLENDQELLESGIIQNLRDAGYVNAGVMK